MRNFFNHNSRFPFRHWNYHNLVINEKSYLTSTNGIENLNKQLKFFLGLGYLDSKRLNKEMYQFHKKFNFIKNSLIVLRLFMPIEYIKMSQNFT